MADTKRTIAEMQALLADNGAKDINAQRIRDMLVTLNPSHGELYLSSNAVTSITDQVSYFPVAGTYALRVPMEWAMDVNGQLKYTGAPDQICHIAVSLSFTVASNNQTIDLTVRKNGTEITGAQQQRKVGTGSDVGSTALHTADRLSTGDYLDVAVRNLSSTANVTVLYLNLFVMGMAVSS